MSFPSLYATHITCPPHAPHACYTKALVTVVAYVTRLLVTVVTIVSAPQKKNMNRLVSRVM